MICCRWGLPAASKILLVQVRTLFFSQPSFRMRFSILPEGELLTGFAMRSDSEGCVTTFPCKKEIKRMVLASARREFSQAAIGRSRSAGACCDTFVCVYAAPRRSREHRVGRRPPRCGSLGDAALQIAPSGPIVPCARPMHCGRSPRTADNGGAEIGGDGVTASSGAGCG
jgi:hypothetical protein